MNNTAIRRYPYDLLFIIANLFYVENKNAIKSTGKTMLSQIYAYCERQKYVQTKFHASLYVAFLPFYVLPFSSFVLKLYHPPWFPACYVSCFIVSSFEVLFSKCQNQLQIKPTFFIRQIWCYYVDFQVILLKHLQTWNPISKIMYLIISNIHKNG